MEFPNPHILGFDLARLLKASGVPQESALDFYWVKMRGNKPFPVDSHRDKIIEEAWGYATYAAFTASEIGRWLPERIADAEGRTYRLEIAKRRTDVAAGETSNNVEDWECRYVGATGARAVHRTRAASLPDALAKMLLRLVKSGRVHPKEFVSTSEETR